MGFQKMIKYVFLRVLFRNLTFIILFCGLSLAAFGQAIPPGPQDIKEEKDSVDINYGPETTRFIMEENLRYGRPYYTNYDSTLQRTHLFNPYDLLDRKYQDLGNVGTAMRPIFFETPEVIGRSSGYYVYDYYFTGPEKIRYYDTQSPYSQLDILLGGNGRAITDVNYSRMINPDWNVGMSFTSYAIDKQLGRTLRRGDRHALNTPYNGYTYYRTKDQRYHVMANFSRMYHRVFESGGILLDENSVEEDLYAYEDATLRLLNSRSKEFRTNTHVYQQFAIVPGIQIYHSLDRTKQAAYFYSFPLSGADGSRLGDILIATDSTKEKNTFRQLSNEIGAKGKYKGATVGGFLKLRQVAFEHRFLPDEQATEFYFGGFANYSFDSLQFITARAEFMTEGPFRFEGKMRTKWLNAKVVQASFLPAFIHQQFFGNHYEWYNDFSNTLSTQIEVGLPLKYNMFRVQPKVSFTNVANMIYFGPDRRPTQVDGSGQLSTFGLDWQLTFARFIHFEGEALYSLTSGTGGDVFRVPQYFANSLIYYGGPVRGTPLELNVGIDIHTKSSFYAYGYDPITMQFYLQNNFQNAGFVAADLFLSFKVSRARIFAKMTHANMGLIGNGGYFVTPFYTGQYRIFDFGVRWAFFD